MADDELDNENLTKAFTLHKTIMDSLPAITEEAQSTNDYTKVDAVHDLLGRLNKLAEGHINAAGIGGDEAPTGTDVGMNVPNPLQDESGLPKPQPPAALQKEVAAPPAALTPMSPPTAFNRSKAARDEQRLTGENPEIPKSKNQLNSEQYKAATSTIDEATKAVKGYVENMEAVVAAGSQDPTAPNHYVIDEALKGGNWKKVASEIRGVLGQVSELDKPSLKELLPKAEAAAKAQEVLNDMRKQGGPLALTREEVMPRVSGLQREKTQLNEQLRDAGTIEAPQLLQRKAEIEKQLENASEFEKMNPPAALTPETPVGVTQGEPGEAEAGQPQPPAAFQKDKTEEAPVDLELQREFNNDPGKVTAGIINDAATTGSESTKNWTTEDYANAGMVDENGNLTKEGLQAKQSGTYTPDPIDKYIAAAEKIRAMFEKSKVTKEDFEKRVKMELGEDVGSKRWDSVPKAIWNIFLLLITQGAIGAQWRHEDAQYQQLKAKIGSEMFGEEKNATNKGMEFALNEMRSDTAAKRQKELISAQYDKAMEQINAANDRADAHEKNQYAIAAMKDWTTQRIAGSRVSQQQLQFAYNKGNPDAVRLNDVNMKINNINKQIMSMTTTAEQQAPQLKTLYLQQAELEDKLSARESAAKE